MFSFRDHREGDVRVDVAFTDSSVDLQGLRPGLRREALPRVEECLRRPLRADEPGARRPTSCSSASPAPLRRSRCPPADALVTATHGLGLMVRVADCVPVLLADTGAGVVAAVHAGRAGVALGGGASRGGADARAGRRRRCTPGSARTCAAAATRCPSRCVRRWPRWCPQTWAETTWGTPSLDLGAGVRAQLDARSDVSLTEVGRCTLEDPALHSHRRDAAVAGRMAGLVWTS